MMDWAEIAATNSIDEVVGGKPVFKIADIAAALRKAKADGMREAAAETEMAVSANGLSEAIARVRAEADKIERGEP